MRAEDALHQMKQRLARVVGDMNRLHTPGPIEQKLNNHLDALGWIHEKAELLDGDVFALSQGLQVQPLPR